MFSSFFRKSVNTKERFIDTGLLYFEDEDIQAKDLRKEQSDVDHDWSDGSCQLEVHG